MKDNEIRGLVLRNLYDARHTKGLVKVPRDLSVEGFDLSKLEDAKIVGNVTKQLADQGLVDFHQVISEYPSGLAAITAYGVDVVEGGTRPPIPIFIPTVYAHHVDQSVTVHGSYNQVGKGNVQNFGTIEKINLAIEQSHATEGEKEEAKSLLARLSENRLLIALLAKFGIDLS